jgi:hypothetical protein
MPSVDAGRQNGHHSGAPEAAISVDEVGRIRLRGPVNGDSATEMAQRVCRALGPLLLTEVSPVTVQCLGNEGSQLGMVMLREEGDAGAHFRSGTARGTNEAEAVVGAVAAALGAEQGVLAGTVEHWAGSPETAAVTVVVGDEVVASTGGPDAAAAHMRLSSALPAPGRLAVGTEDTEYRVLRLPDAAFAVSATPGAAVLADLDVWMGVVEAHRASADDQARDG